MTGNQRQFLLEQFSRVTFLLEQADTNRVLLCGLGKFDIDKYGLAISKVVIMLVY